MANQQFNNTQNFVRPTTAHPKSLSEVGSAKNSTGGLVAGPSFRL
jgi:hypothetical protein